LPPIFFSVLLVAVLLLAGCGSGNKKPAPQLLAISLQAPQSLTIDLNISAQASFNLVASYDDNTQKVESYTAFWNAENEDNELTVTNSANTPIEIDYDAQTVIAGSPLVLYFAIKGQKSLEQVEIPFRLVPLKGEGIFTIVPRPLETDLYVGANPLQLQVGGVIEGEDVSDILRLVNCSTDPKKSTVSVTPDCKVTGLRQGPSKIKVALWEDSEVFTYVGVNVLPVYVQELIIDGSKKMFINSTQRLTLQANQNNGKTVMDARTIARCLPVTAENGIVLITEDCVVSAGSDTGIVSVTAELIEPQADVTVSVSDFVLSVVPEFVSETIPLSIPGDEYEYFHQFSTDVYASYKIKVYSDVAATERFALTVMATDNIPCFNELASGNQTVACGIDTTGTDGLIDVWIDVPNGGFSGKLELTEDRDILDNDNMGTDFPETLADYVFLQAGELRQGHVSSNASGKAANESRYYTDITNGLLATAPGYQVIVRFEPDDDGEYHFDTNNVKVGWRFDNDKGFPIIYSKPTDCFVQVPDTVICDVIAGQVNLENEEEQVDLFVFVYGNGDEIGVNAINASPATADGELSYTVQINNKQ